MVKWSDTWLKLVDANGIEVGCWAAKYDVDNFKCTLCGVTNSFKKQGFHALKQHSTKRKHKSISDIRFSKSAVHLAVPSEPSGRSGTSKQFLSEASTASTVTIAPSLKTNITSSEANWILKVASSDYSLRSCDDTPRLFQDMFCDSDIAKGFTMGRSKASYCVPDGLGPMLLKGICDQVMKSRCGFTLMFDETTTHQVKKQMDILIRYWSPLSNEVITRYLTSFFFGRAPAMDIVLMFKSLRERADLNLPWNLFFNISCDGPNINKSIWRLLNEELIKCGSRVYFLY